MAFIFYSLSPLKPNKHLLLCFFSLYCLLCGTSCWITQENLFWAILSLFFALPHSPSLTSQKLTLYCLLNFSALCIFRMICDHPCLFFFFFTVWGKEIAPLSEKTFFFLLVFYFLSTHFEIFKIVGRLLLSSIPIVLISFFRWSSQESCHPKNRSKLLLQFLIIWPSCKQLDYLIKKMSWVFAFFLYSSNLW